MSDMKKPLIVLSTGGTGGHLFPAQSLAANLVDQGYDCHLATDKAGAQFKSIIPIHIVAAGPLSRSKDLYKNVFKLFWGTFQSIKLLRKLKPIAVVGFGSYASTPVLAAAKILKIPSVIHEQNAVFGKANRLFAPAVTAIATGFEKTLGIHAKYKSKSVVTGNPVRPEIKEMQAAPYPSLDQNTPLKILIFGGSKGASILSNILPKAIALLSEEEQKRLMITQQARSEDIDTLRESYKSLGIQANVYDFIDGIAEQIVSAHLVIARSGASTIAELTTIGRPAIFVPYPYATEDHQLHQAKMIEEAGGAWLIPEKSFTAKLLAHKLQSFLQLPNTLIEAADLMAQQGHPDATQNLAALVLEKCYTDDVTKSASQLKKRDKKQST